jgi:hypothetical protein
MGMLLMSEVPLEGRVPERRVLFLIDSIADCGKELEPFLTSTGWTTDRSSKSTCLRVITLNTVCGADIVTLHIKNVEPELF